MSFRVSWSLGHVSFHIDTGFDTCIGLFSQVYVTFLHTSGGAAQAEVSFRVSTSFLHVSFHINLVFGTYIGLFPHIEVTFTHSAQDEV